MFEAAVGQKRRKRVVLSLIFSISILPLISSSQEFTPEMRAEMNQRINMQRDWGNETKNSPGARLVAKETARVGKAPGPIVVRYQLFARGMPQDLTYQLLTFPITVRTPDDAGDMGMVHVDKNDQIIDAANHDELDTFCFDPAPGEPWRFALIAENLKYKAYLSVVPNPIEGRDADCRVSVIRLTPRFELAFIQAIGFPGESEVEVQTNSLGEIQNRKLKTNTDGYVDAAIMPFVKDKSKGETKIRIVSPKCHPETTFHWGTTDE